MTSPQASLAAQMVKNLPAINPGWSLGWEDLLEKGIATHSSILAWRISWTEKPGGLQSMQLQRVRHDWVIERHVIRQPGHREPWSHTKQSELERNTEALKNIKCVTYLASDNFPYRFVWFPFQRSPLNRLHRMASTK